MEGKGYVAEKLLDQVCQVSYDHMVSSLKVAASDDHTRTQNSQHWDYVLDEDDELGVLHGHMSGHPSAKLKYEKRIRPEIPQCGCLKPQP
ncbi:hypothetical protein MRX96_043699 [Rhipicephalus microplus]